MNARWVWTNRRLPSGGFAHDAKDVGGPVLVDSLEMARAPMYLHWSTGECEWLREARGTADFIAKHLIEAQTGGFLTAVQPAGAFMHKAMKRKDDNVLATRLFNDLFGYTADACYREVAEAGMGYLSSEAVLEAFYFLPGVSQAEQELRKQRLYLNVVGAKYDPAAAKLHAAVLAFAALHKRAGWWDRSEGPLANAEVRYPQMPTVAAFACSGIFCSLPATTRSRAARRYE